MNNVIDKDKLKYNLTIEQVLDYVNELGGEGIKVNDNIATFRTICHGGDSHKLYYYNNTHLFKCYTQCENTGGFDIFELTQKVKKLNGENFSLFQAIEYVANFFGIILKEENGFTKGVRGLADWNVLNNYQKVDELKANKDKIVEFKIFNQDTLKFFPTPHIETWEQEGIDYKVMREKGICFDPLNLGVVIPHYDINGRLIGIRERTLVKEDEIYGKYRPAFINGTLYNHPLGFNLYNLNYSKNNIATIKKAVVFEGEKSCLLFSSYFGADADISCAVCGSSFTSHQIKLLLSLGVEEIIIGFDKQFKESGDEEWKKWTKKLIDIHTRYSPYCQISFLFDKENLLEYKMSPVDAGKDVFLELFNKRIFL